MTENKQTGLQIKSTPSSHPQKTTVLVTHVSTFHIKQFFPHQNNVNRIGTTEGPLVSIIVSYILLESEVEIKNPQKDLKNTCTQIGPHFLEILGKCESFRKIWSKLWQKFCEILQKFNKKFLEVIRKKK